MKQQKTGTGFLHTSAVQAQSAIFNFSELCALYMAVHIIEWQIRQRLV